MLTHSSLDDIEYSNHTHSPRKPIKRHRRSTHGQNCRKFTKKFHSVSDTCAVCLDNRARLDTKLFPCGHTFHSQCLIQWVTSQQGKKFDCPLCRRDIAHFIQMIPNQQLDDELTQIWNDRYLYNDSNTNQNHSNGHKSPKCTEKIHQKMEAPAASVTSHEIYNDHVPSAISTWKYIWTLATYPISPNVFSMFNMWEHFMYSPSNMYDDIISNHHLSHNNSHTNRFQSHFMHKMPKRKYPDHDIDGEYHGNMQSDEHLPDTNSLKLATKTTSNVVKSAGDLADILRFDLINLKAGIFAGICAGATTYFVSQQLKSESAFTKTLRPVLGESVPNVAIFFTSYEHLKRYLFHVDNVNNGWYQTYSQRFISAGIASSIACVVSGGGVAGILPLRYAAFFGTFELCKDILNKRHEELNFISVATSAAVGGTVAHGLYYPTMQYKNMVMTQVATVDVGVVNSAKSMLCKNMYRGFVSSLNKFLPSCVVCSCAFEYSKRYFNS